MNSAVELNDVRKSFGTVVALAGLDLALEAGEIHAILGPNGAGKTTAISMMAGLRQPDSGRVQVLGGDPRDVRVRCRIGLTPQESGFPPNLRVAEILRLVRAHYEAPLMEKDLAATFPVYNFLDRQAGGLSGGQRRILSAALAFLGNPELVFLDEPTTGLDAVARKSLWDAIRMYRDRGTTIILTTHYLEEAEALASQVSVIHGGRRLIQDSVHGIRSRFGQCRISYTGEARHGLAGIARIECDGDEVVAFAHDADAAVQALVTEGVRFSGLQIRPASLEESLTAITGNGK